VTSELFKELLVSEEDLTKEAVRKAKDLVGIEEKTGQVIIKSPKGNFGQRQLAALFLIGQYFSTRLGLAKSSNLSLRELAEKTGIDANTLSGRLSELGEMGWVTKPSKASFEFNPYALNEALDEIISSRRKSDLAQPMPADTVSRSQEQTEETGDFPLIGKGKSLTDTIVEIMKSGWGKNPRDWTEIQRTLKHNALHYSQGSVTGTLTLLTQSGRLRRIKEGRSYKYVAP
jgi:transcriptional regulator with XRE-family HTH domain